MDYKTRLKKITMRLYRKQPETIPIMIFDKEKIIVLAGGKEKIFENETAFYSQYPSAKPIKVEVLY